MSNILAIIEESGSVLDDREIEIIQNKTQRKKRQKKKKEQTTIVLCDNFKQPHLNVSGVYEREMERPEKLFEIILAKTFQI